MTLGAVWGIQMGFPGGPGSEIPRGPVSFADGLFSNKNTDIIVHIELHN